MKAGYGSIIDVDPEARFFLRFNLEIYDKWWLEMYPEEREIDSDGNRQQQSFASLVWREQAKDLLRCQLYSVAEVADLVGYANANYFSKAFKKETGQNPWSFMHGR